MVSISPTPSAQKGNRNNVRRFATIIVAIFFLIVYPRIYIQLTTSQPPPSSYILGPYTGKTWSTPQTISVTTAAETPFARCDLHTVKSEDGKILDGWLFFEEKNAVNVVVTTADEKFIVFRQKKYAIEGMTYSPVGGFIDDGETPYDAAKREVLEELGLGSRQAFDNRNEKKQLKQVIKQSGWNADGAITDDDPDWIFLGIYRTAANRGAGFIYLYLLKNAIPFEEGAGTSRFKGTGDDEGQDILEMSKDEVYKNLRESQFKEVKWGAAVSLALHHLNGEIL